ncbi:DNA polymerase III subunit beta [Sulfoacidibacillus thermotolerans]|uniref:Beta sliding clamp n=1 Tax=Sulfoacidibacillus thermotolerans TaxID=1765684 RepID=A0A2U3D6A3_SULT2|nr:DNA polymerase III subunit beta [Sulfoacidibacillus thermotolerans]PWI56807.1 DNA polymerase III subunit beta [Sulfoacidibacillus thermotolerans]
MRIVILKSLLSQALQTISKAIPTRTTKPILYGVYLEVFATHIQLTAYDQEIGIQTIVHPTDDPEPTLQIEQTGSIVLHAKYLLDIVRKLPHKLVRIDVTDLTATIRSGSATYTLNGMDPREYPHLPSVTEEMSLSMPSNVLISLIEQTAFATATSEIRPTLTGVLFSFVEPQLRFIASDSHRLSIHSIYAETKYSYDKLEAIIPGKSLNELLKILPDSEEFTDIYIADNQLLVTFGATKFYSRLIEGQYPDISRIIPTTWRTAIEVDPKQFTESIERAALLARENENQVIRLYLRRTHIEVTSNSPDIGKVTETIDPISFEGDDLQIACNAKFLLDALKALNNYQVRIEFTSPGSAFILKPTNSDRPLHLILPVRFGPNT